MRNPARETKNFLGWIVVGVVMACAFGALIAAADHMIGWLFR